MAAVDFELQAETHSGDPEDYSPLFDCRGLPSWPAEPFYDQLRDTEKLRCLDLESYYSGDVGVRTLTLEAGRHIDTLLLAPPVQCLPFLCKDLARWNRRWRQMVTGVKAVQALSFQVWLSRSTTQSGWKGPARPVLSLYVQHLNTWSDMSQVLARETWPAWLQAHSVQYYTGPQPGPVAPPLPSGKHRNFPALMKDRAKKAALTFLKENYTTLLPNTASARGGTAIDWDLLVSLPNSRGGPERFDTKYWHSNCEPHERCPVALPGTGRYRLKAEETGYTNLVITGDLIDNGIHVACLKGAVMGGIYAARAIAGIPFPIIGEMLNDSVFGRMDS